jgi:hypothetical protein
MSFSIRRVALTSVCLAAVAALTPIACSSKAPEAESILGCRSDAACENGYCDNGVCKPRCSPANNTCPVGETCNADGRCVTGGSGGTGGTSSGGTSSGGTAGVITIIPEAGPDADDDGSLDPDAACGTGSATATLTPVSMFVMFDRSGSMLTDTMPTRWDNAATALTAFFQDPEAADLAVALRFFPHTNPAMGCTNNSMSGCIAADCAQPLVPLMADPLMPLAKLSADPAPMDTHEAELVAAITASAPVMGSGNSGGTPTHAALQGALEWATAYQTAHPRPEQQTVVVLVTDGEPNGCGNSCSMNGGNREACLTGISMLASTALANSDIRTYVVGLTDEAASLAFLDDLAVAGGTNEAFIVLDGPTSAMELADALKAIQGSALSCDFAYPMVADGGMSDPAKINVDYTPGAQGSAKVPFYRVENEAACATSTQPSWYYDNPMMPTRIFLCPSACTTVTADTGAKLDIQIGCTSREPPVM